MAKKPAPPSKENLKAIEEGWTSLRAHPLFGGLTGLVFGGLIADRPMSKDGYARIAVASQRIYRAAQGKTIGGFEQRYQIECNGRRRAAPAEWANVQA